MNDPNEQMASLCGWIGYYDVDSQWWELPSETAKRERSDDVPDYTQWEHFSEMQELARAHPEWQMTSRLPNWVYVTPTIIRDAILAVTNGA